MEPTSNDEALERQPLLGRFPYNLVMEVSASEPRDVLQSERTTLTFTRFATTLMFTALGMILNFKINSTGEGKEPEHHASDFSRWCQTVVSYVLLVLSLFTLILSGVNYMVTVRRYANHKIQTFAFNNWVTAVCFSAVVITLAAVCVLFIVEGYLS
ncbi:hypothetical protein DICA0_A05974 [Diutina catenulata]